MRAYANLSRPGSTLASVRQAVLVAVVASVAASACAEIGEPDLGVGSVAPSVTSVENADEAVVGDDVDDATDVEPEATPLPVFSPPRPEGYVPTLAVVTDSATLVVDDAVVDGLVAVDGEVIEGGAVGLALGDGVVPDRIVDDFFGGLVIEDVVLDEDGNEVRAVSWVRPADPEGSILATGVSLLDVGFIDSTLEAHVLVKVDEGVVDRIKLVDGERAPFASLAEGQTLVDLSASEGLHAVIVSDAECGDLLFWNSSGEMVDVGGPGLPACAVARRPAYGAVDLSPDATLVAYTVLTYRSDGVVATTDVVVRELGSGAVVFTAAVGGVGEDVRSLTFDGTRLAYVRSGPDQDEIVVLSTDGDSAEQPLALDVVPRGVVFARQPLAVGVNEAEAVPVEEVSPDG